jgi:hypothetical protein
MQMSAFDSIMDKEAEQAVLGSMMTEKSIIPRIARHGDLTLQIGLIGYNTKLT